jgi:hypothetical protein
MWDYAMGRRLNLQELLSLRRLLVALNVLPEDETSSLKLPISLSSDVSIPYNGIVENQMAQNLAKCLYFCQR